jgi:tetratricopeptide (TPR) repeat protein
LKPRKEIIDGLAQAPAVEDRLTAADLLLHPETTHLMAQVAALGFFVKRYLRPNMEILETSIVESLERLALDEDLDVSSVALAALHIARGEDPETRKFLYDVLSSLNDTDRAVRGRWVSAVQVFGDVYLERGEKWNAITLYLKALEVLPRHPGILLSLGWTYNSLGDYANAVEYYERSLEVHPHQPEVQADLDVARQNLARWRTR